MKNTEDNNSLSMFSKETLDSLEMAEITGGDDTPLVNIIGCINGKCSLIDSDCIPSLPNYTCHPNLDC